MNNLQTLDLRLMILLGLVLLTQGTWLFLDARKRDAHAWFWGLWGFVRFPEPLILYWLFVRKQIHKRKRKTT